MPKHAKKSNLGRTLVKDRFGPNKKHARGESMLHAAELGDGADWNRINLRSVTEASNLDDFLATAELAGTEFKAARLNMKFVPPTSKQGMLSAEERENLAQQHEKLKSCLRIPRRPAWNANTSPEELDVLERESFLEWRRRLAELESGPEGVILTPFEKNLEFWRQLWRVVERSDVVVQIVDARNPLLFRCEDLEHYVKEVSPEKQNVILINKADFLTRKQRDMWADHFSKEGIKTIFFSATNDIEDGGVEEEDYVSSDGEDADEAAAIEEAKKRKDGGGSKPGSLGLDAYYAQLDASAPSQKLEKSGPAEDENVNSDSDDEVPYLVEAPVSSQKPVSSGHPEVDAMRIHGDSSLVTKTIVDRCAEVRDAGGLPKGDLKDALLAPEGDMPVAISEVKDSGADGDEEWEDVDSDEDEEDQVVDECIDEDGAFVLHEEDIAEIIMLDDDDEPPPSSSEDEDADVDETGAVAMREEDIAEIISLDGGEPPSSSSDVDEDADEEMDQFDEEEYRRKIKEEERAAVRRQVKLMYEQRQKAAVQRSDVKSSAVKNSGRCLNREDLIRFFEKVHAGRRRKEAPGGRPAAVTIGLVGYPNVGKSSTINSLLKCKKVSVSTTPGKTKHFQTIFLSKDVVLCDCPGLVMPSFLSTKAGMVVSGILPIDQLRDHVPAINEVASLIPRKVLEKTYGIILPTPEETEDPNRPPTSEELLNAYGFLRGYMTQRGLPDNPRTARYILKDFVSGKLLYCHPPPGCDKAAFEAETKRSHPDSDSKAEARKESDLPATFKKMVKGSQGTNPSVRDVDAAFFSSLSSQVHKKGPTLVKNSMESVAGGSGTAPGKPWKKHGNKNRKEKLRRVYAHLDA